MRCTAKLNSLAIWIECKRLAQLSRWACLVTVKKLKIFRSLLDLHRSTWDIVWTAAKEIASSLKPYIYILCSLFAAFFLTLGFVRFTIPLQPLREVSLRPLHTRAVSSLTLKNNVSFFSMYRQFFSLIYFSALSYPDDAVQLWQYVKQVWGTLLCWSYPRLSEMITEVYG